MKKLLFSVLVLFLLNSPVLAKELKIGVIDMNQVLQKSPMMIAVNEKLTKTFTPRQQELNNVKKQLQEETDELNLKGDTMSADERGKLQNKIISDKANVAVLQASLEKDLAIAKNTDLQIFMTKFTEVIQKIAKEENYDIIEQRNTIIYLNESLDLTQKVIQQMT